MLRRIFHLRGTAAYFRPAAGGGDLSAVL